jgi:hypothetical protein
MAEETGIELAGPAAGLARSSGTRSFNSRGIRPLRATLFIPAGGVCDDALFCALAAFTAIAAASARIAPKVTGQQTVDARCIKRFIFDSGIDKRRVAIAPLFRLIRNAYGVS